VRGVLSVRIRTAVQYPVRTQSETIAASIESNVLKGARKNASLDLQFAVWLFSPAHDFSDYAATQERGVLSFYRDPQQHLCSLPGLR